MLQLKVLECELYDEVKGEFRYVKEQTLQLEHSLVSLSKWESKWHKPFMSKKEMSTNETIDYIKCMTITQNVNPDIYRGLTSDNILEVKKYIDDSMTATTFSNQTKTSSTEIVTSEIIYYWMVSLNIPFECQKWHLNRLFALINVCGLKNAPKKKMSRNEILSSNSSLNEARRRAMNTKG